MKTYRIQYTYLGHPWKVLNNQFGESYELITLNDAKSVAIIHSQLEGYSTLAENWVIVDSEGKHYQMGQPGGELLQTIGN